MHIVKFSVIVAEDARVSTSDLQTYKILKYVLGIRFMPRDQLDPQEGLLLLRCSWDQMHPSLLKAS